jgi:hypothetical protein
LDTLQALKTNGPLNALRALWANWSLDTLQPLNTLRPSFYAGGDPGLRDAVMPRDMTMMPRLAMMIGVTMTQPR